jgi:hypothetical protein
MVRLMENHPRVALIQTPPVPVNRESLFARILQFAGSLYGRMFTAGLNYWQLGESNYWGHNAIIRIQPFLDHCGLPKLPGREPFGGEILSHDFVEAALLRRAGWEVWLAYDLEGSYEEIPPTLIDYAKRDRRWCQGNLQHLRLAFRTGFNALSRLHFLMGVMSYAASPLWLLFLIATGVDAYLQTQQELVYFLRAKLDAGVAGVVCCGNDHGIAGHPDHAVLCPSCWPCCCCSKTRLRAPMAECAGRPERVVGDGVFGADRAGIDAVSDQVRAGDPDASCGRLAAAATRRSHDQL